MQIEKLPQFIVNQIAAGEVIERPASIIKELVENSIDAHSSKIEISIVNAGKSYISIYDNGDGIQKDDFHNAVTLHATSKLHNLNLNEIDYLGFRGEALASIASVAKISITSKYKDSNETWKAIYDKNNVKDLIPATLNSGTKIEVSDLFFSVPARLNFLKTDATELSNIINTCKQIILPYNNISLRLSSNNRLILNYPPSTIKIRISDILGNEFTDDLYELNYDSEACKITGFVGKPTLNFNTQNKLFFYINGRYVKDKYLSLALKNAYSNLIPHDRYPIAVLFIDLPKKDFDVNVHPRKLEVRFRDIKKLQQNIDTAVKNIISKVSNISSVFIANNFRDSLINIQNKNYKKSNETLTEIKNFNNDLIFNNPTSKINSLQEDSSNFEIDFIPEFSGQAEEQEHLQQNNLFELQTKTSLDNIIDLGTAVTQFMNKYIISKSSEFIFLIDQHAVHERVVFEKLKKNFYDKRIESQQLLIPEMVYLSENDIELLNNNKDQIKELGITFKKISNDSIEITSLPIILIESNKSELIKDLIEDFTNDDDVTCNNSMKNKIERILATFACHTSIRSGKTLSVEEMNQILKLIETTENSAQCNHGRPSYIKLSLKDLDKLFERI